MLSKDSDSKDVISRYVIIKGIYIRNYLCTL